MKEPEELEKQKSVNTRMEKKQPDIHDREWYQFKILKHHEKNRQREENQRVKNKREFNKKMKWVFIVSILAISLYLLINWYQAYRMKTYGVNIKAIIVNIRHDIHLINELESNSLDHYYVTYDYWINNKEYHGLSDIVSDNYSLYLPKNAQSGDTINIRCIPSSPKEVQIIEYK